MLDLGPDAAQMEEAPKVAAPASQPEVSDPAELTMLVRVTNDPKQRDAWSLVLTSKDVSPLLRWTDSAFEVHVARADLTVASRELDAFDAEELVAQRARLADAANEERRATRYAGLGSVLVALMLMAFFAVTGPRAAGSTWFSVGSSDASQVLNGEWWRTVTALTLHADGPHVLSNVGIGTLVVGAVMRSEGIGFGAALVLASGAIGNFVNAWAHHALHNSVGFSTAVFGAIGILGGLAYVRSGRRASKVRPAWTALGVSLALLALLGTGGERTDVFAHLFGGLAGLGLGLLVAWTDARPIAAAGQWFAGAGAAATVAGSWMLAIG